MTTNELIINGVDVKTLFANLNPSEEMWLMTIDFLKAGVSLEDAETLKDYGLRVVELGVKNIVVEPQMYEFNFVRYDRVGMIFIVKEDGNLTILK